MPYPCACPPMDEHFELLPDPTLIPASKSGLPHVGPSWKDRPDVGRWLLERTCIFDFGTITELPRVEVFHMHGGAVCVYVDETNPHWPIEGMFKNDGMHVYRWYGPIPIDASRPPIEEGA